MTGQLVPPFPVIPQPIPAEEQPSGVPTSGASVFELKDSYVIAIYTASLGQTKAAINLLEHISYDHGFALWCYGSTLWAFAAP